MMKKLTVLLFLLLSGAVIQAQNIVSPLDIPLLLSGNFGELRHNHFHSGLDIKTEGRIGLPVKAVKAGFISRISVGPYGYGRAVYIVHPDGTTSVYGHLDHFTPPIASAVIDSQYRQESFSVNLHFSSSQFPVKQGEVFAYSGNSGGSGGPHLHLEFRETAGDKSLDPLPFFKNLINDTKAPEIRAIRLFPLPGKGLVNGSRENQSFVFKKNKKGVQLPLPSIEAWGEIGIGIKAYDRMNETANIYGVNEIQLKVDGKEVYHSFMDAFFIDDTRYLNSCIDWTEWIENRSFYMKSFTEPGNFLGINRSSGFGIIRITEEKTYRIEYILKDAYGNTTRQTFDIVGKKKTVPPVPAYETLLLHNKDNRCSGKGFDLEIPRKNLYTDIYLNTDTVFGYSPFAPLYIIGERLPLHSYCPITLDVSYDTYPDKTKYGLVQVYKGKKTWIGGSYQNKRVTGRTRELGRFTVDVDSVPPLITPLKQEKWATTRCIAFKITDDLSGIDSYRGTLDGKFILFEYDAKSNSLFADYEPERMKEKTQTLKLTVWDGAGNQSEISLLLLPRQ